MWSNFQQLVVSVCVCVCVCVCMGGGGGGIHYNHKSTQIEGEEPTS